MKEITVTDSNAVTHATNIKNAFDTYGTGYFDSITIDTESEDGYTFVRFFKGGTNLMSLQIPTTYKNPNSTNYMSIKVHTSGSAPNVPFGYKTYSSSYVWGYGTRLRTIIFTDNAVIFKQMQYDGPSYYAYVVLCKTADGDLTLAVPFTTSSTSTVMAMSSVPYFNAQFRIRTYNIETGDEFLTTYYSTTNTSAYVVGSSFINLPKGPPKNVYYALNACYRTIVEPFVYTINGESYVGIGGNSIIIKSQ